MLREWEQNIQENVQTKPSTTLKASQTYAIANKHNIPWQEVEDWAWFNKVPQDKYKEIINSEGIIEAMKKFLTKVKE